MLPRKNRLPREAFRARGYRAVTTHFFSLKAKENTLAVNRIGVVVGKSVDKRAVRRNFLERRAKANLFKMQNLGKDIIITIFPKANLLSRKQFAEEIKKAIIKIF